MRPADLRQRRPTTTGSQEKASRPSISPPPPPLSSSSSSLFSPLFVFLFLFRLFSAFSCPLQDCDEVFNYWEPLHYLIFNFGLQTWEYSPEFGLRSFLYLSGYGLPIDGLARLFGSEDKIFLFFAMKLTVAAISSLVEFHLINTVARRFSPSLARTFSFLLVGSAGAFHASSTILPQTFTANCTTLAISYWGRGNYKLAIVCLAVAGLIGWPFVLVLALPIGLDVLIDCLSHRRYGDLFSLFFLSFSLFFFLVALSVGFDWPFFDKPVWAIWNIATYNSIQNAQQGANLYGVEPASYWVKNLLLNFNLAAPLAFLQPFLALACRAFKTSEAGDSLAMLKFLSPSILWLLVMFAMPHKEERFLYVIYPQISLAAAFSLDILAGKVPKFLLRGGNFQRLSRTILIMGISAIALLGASRVSALIIYYRAPLQVYSAFYYENSQQAPSIFAFTRPETFSSPETSALQTLCVGKEWYRFPSSFFLPANFRLKFLQSGFSGLLPGEFPSNASTAEDRTIGTRQWPRTMNNKNREEPAHYLTGNIFSHCDWLVDLEGISHQREAFYSSLTGEIPGRPGRFSFKTIFEAKFLDAEHSEPIARAFFIPGYSNSAGRTKFLPYRLMKREKIE